MTQAGRLCNQDEIVAMNVGSCVSVASLCGGFDVENEVAVVLFNVLCESDFPTLPGSDDTNGYELMQGRNRRPGRFMVQCPSLCLAILDNRIRPMRGEGTVS
jgi:hypothetical protein